MAEAADFGALTWAYRQWKFARNLLRRMMQRANEANPVMDRRMLNHSVKDTFGRWLQTMQLFSRDQLHEKFPLFPREPMHDERSKDELVRMLQQLFRLNPEDAEEFVTELLTTIADFLARNESLNGAADIEVQFEEDREHPENGGRIVVAEFETRRCPRVSCLVHHYGKLATALVCLQYEPLGYYMGGESGMSVRALNALHDIGGATYEGFASPLNCRLLGRPDITFCSVFADTDFAFGSLGNFFSIELSDHPGGWILNPPFVEPVMEATARRVLAILEDAEPGTFWFYITFPMWENNEGWQMLEKSKRTIARLDFPIGSIRQQDAHGFIYQVNVPLRIFVLGQLPNRVNLIRLCKDLGDNADEATIMADWLEACDIAT